MRQTATGAADHECVEGPYLHVFEFKSAQKRPNRMKHTNAQAHGTTYAYVVLAHMHSIERQASVAAESVNRGLTELGMEPG